MHRCCGSWSTWKVVAVLLLPVAALSAQDAAKEASYKGKPVSHWVKRLEDPEVKARREAVMALGFIGPEAAAGVPALIKALDDDDTPVRELALRALGQVGPPAKAAVPHLIAALKDRDASYRLAAVKSLGAIGPEARTAVPALLKMIEPLPASDPRPAGAGDLRIAVFETLGRIGPEARVAVPILIDGLRDEQAPSQQTIPAALAGIGPEVVPVLLEALKANKDVRNNMEVRIRGGVGKALILLGADSVPALIEALKEPDPDLRQTVIHLLQMIGPGARPAIPALAGVLKTDALHRQQAADALSAIGPESAAFLLRALRDANPQVRAAAAGSLGRLGAGSPTILQPLGEALKDDDRTVRTRAGLALQNIGSDAVPLLLKALKDKDTAGQAAGILVMLGPRAAPAVPDLIVDLKDKDAATRLRAVRLLGAIGPPAKEAEKAIAEVLEDPDKEVRQQAIETLKRIRGRP